VFAALVREVTPLNAFEPVNVWLRYSSDTVVESRASFSGAGSDTGGVEAAQTAPLPVKLPTKLFWH